MKYDMRTQFRINICRESVTNHGLYRIEKYNSDLVMQIDLIRPGESIFPSDVLRGYVTGVLGDPGGNRPTSPVPSRQCRSCVLR